MSKRSFRSLLTLVAASLVASCGLVPDAQMRGADATKAIAFDAPSQVLPIDLKYQDRKQLATLANMGTDIWSVDVRNQRALAALNQKQYEKALELGIKMTRRNDRFLRNSFDEGYHTYDSMLKELREVAAKHPDLCELVDVGDSWEKTQGKANRDLWAIHFKKAGPNKPVVLYAAAHHAREIVTPEMAIGMVHHLADNYGHDAEVTGNVDTRDIWIVPMVNPDGHALASKGQNQRKNTNNVSGGEYRVGVDLNRNYDAAWGTAGDSKDPDSDVFRGASAFSEPETQAMRDLMTKIKPTFLLTFHSFGNTVMWSWDKSEAPPPDRRLEPIGKAMAAFSGYDAYQGCKMYVNSGDDVDWAAEKLKTLAFTIEIGSWDDGFDPSFSRVARFWDENRPMMMYALKIADNPDAVFGPELSSVTTAQGRLNVQAKAPLAKAEYFVGRPGVAGTGHPMALSGAQSMVSALSTAGGRQLLFVHAKGVNGQWGPWQTAWSN